MQSNYHETDIKDTGETTDDLSGRIVRNRGPITAKIVASGNHGRYCEKGKDGDACHAEFSLVAWKFAGDQGTVHVSKIQKDFDVVRDTLLILKVLHRHSPYFKGFDRGEVSRWTNAQSRRRLLGERWQRSHCWRGYHSDP